MIIVRNVKTSNYDWSACPFARILSRVKRIAILLASGSYATVLSFDDVKCILNLRVTLWGGYIGVYIHKWCTAIGCILTRSCPVGMYTTLHIDTSIDGVINKRITDRLLYR